MLIRSFAAAAAILALNAPVNAGPQDNYSGCRPATDVKKTPTGYAFVVPSGNDAKGPPRVVEEDTGRVYVYNNGSSPGSVCLGYDKDGVPVVYDASVASRGKP